MLKQYYINISLVKALEYSMYVKFLKNIVSKKRRLNEYEIVALTQEISDIFQKQL